MGGAVSLMQMYTEDRPSIARRRRCVGGVAQLLQQTFAIIVSP